MSIAALNGNLEIVEYIYQNVQVNFRDSIVGDAAESGNLEVHEWAWKNYKTTPKTWHRCTFDCGVRSGNIEILEFLKQNGCSIASPTAANYAAAQGSIEILEWMKQNGCNFNIDGVTTNASEFGHIAVLDWLSNNNLINKDMVYGSANNRIEIVLFE